MNRITCRKPRFQAALVVMALSIPIVLAAATGSKAPVEDPVTERELSPMQQAIQDLVDREEAELEVLYTQFASAASHEAALDIQIRIQEAKMNTRVGLFEIQAEYARERGDFDRALIIEGIIERLTVDGSYGEPIDREAGSSE